jgi:hypothetical protein
MWVALLVGLLALRAGAQTIRDGENAFRNAVLKKQMYLRGFGADAEMRWRWDGSSLVQEAPKLHTLGVLIADSVKVKGDKVEIKGAVHTLLRKSPTEVGVFDGGDDRVHLVLDLTGADMAKVLPQLSSLLFYPDMASALANLPEKYRGRLPAKMSADCCGTEIAKPISKTCDCADTHADCSKDGHSVGGVGVKPPSLKFTAEPEFTDAARRAKFSGNAQIGLDVDENGLPKNMWIVRPVGFGLEQKAGEAVEKYVFSPATCHVKPITVSLYIDVNFQVL